MKIKLLIALVVVGAFLLLPSCLPSLIPAPVEARHIELVPGQSLDGLTTYCGWDMINSSLIFGSSSSWSYNVWARVKLKENSTHFFILSREYYLYNIIVNQDGSFVAEVVTK
jgi:hypothetical protein